MNGIPGIARIKSATGRGSCEINLFFDWNTNAKEALQLVQARLAQVSLPPTAQIRHVERLTFAVFPVISYSLTSGKHAPAELNACDLHDKTASSAARRRFRRSNFRRKNARVSR